MTRIALIGFGEAGSLIAKGLRGAGADLIAAYDILIDDPAGRPALDERAQAADIALAPTQKDAVAGADLVISAVTCDQISVAAAATAPHLQAGQLYLDINSTSPRAKRAAGGLIERGGAAFVEAAVMDLVPPHGHKVPMLLAGAEADRAAALLEPYGMNVTAIGERIGDASSIKMVRSVFMKGFSAILLECLYAAGKLGAEGPVLESLQTSYPEFDWHRLADRSLSRLVKHARRQADEMADVAETLAELGIEPLTASATAKRLGWLADRDLQTLPDADRATAADVLRLLQAGDD